RAGRRPGDRGRRRAGRGPGRQRPPRRRGRRGARRRTRRGRGMTDEPTGGVPDRSRGRPETPEQRSDRNWNELLQELRVMQTGVQILTGFLLILPFQSRFADLDDYQRTVYLTLVLVC